MSEWKGLNFTAGFFVVWKDGKFRFGKCDPVTKKIIQWYEYESKK